MVKDSLLIPLLGNAYGRGKLKRYPYDRRVLCPRFVQQEHSSNRLKPYVLCQWDMGGCYLFPAIDVEGPVQAAKRDVAMTLTPQLMIGRLKAHAGHAGLAANG